MKCEPPHHRKNVIVVNGYTFPALENSQISLSCSPGYSFPNRNATTVTSTCTSEAMWWPDPSELRCLSTHTISCHDESNHVTAL